MFWSEMVRPSSNTFSTQMSFCCSGGIPYLSKTLALTFSMLSEGSTSRLMVLPLSISTKICVASASSGSSNKTLNKRLALIVDMLLIGGDLYLATSSV